MVAQHRRAASLSRINPGIFGQGCRVGIYMAYKRREGFADDERTCKRYGRLELPFNFIAHRYSVK